MKHRKLFLALTLISSLTVKGQTLLAESIVGEWGMCISEENLDTICSKPFRIMTFNKDGSCQYGFFDINDEKVPVIGNWSLEGQNILIKFKEHPNFKLGDHNYKKISFIGKDFFFTRREVGNTKRQSYLSFRRIE